jgi:glycosyltransferase involved in cell wall biosynthesis
MRILMLTQSYAPVIGGVERSVEDLSDHLARRGHHVAVATLGAGTDGPTELGGVSIHRLRSLVHRLPGVHLDSERFHATPAPDPLTVADLKRLLEQERPDVVHAHDWLVHSYLPLQRRGNRPLVLSMHDYGLICAIRRFLNDGRTCSGPRLTKCIACAGDYYGGPRGAVVATAVRASSRRVRGRIDMFLPVSAAVRDLCRLRSDESHRIIPNFIGELPEPPSADSPGLDQLPEEPFVLYFGDVTYDKGVKHLLAAHRELERPPPLVLIGRPEMDLPLHERVRVLGPVPHPVVIEALRRSLFTVAPSVLPEAFGLVALESAAAGKPTIASDIGGLRDIVIDDQTGLLVPAGDTAALRSALQRLIADASLRERLAVGATERATDFSAEAVVPLFEQAYREALAARGPAWVSSP